MILGVSRPLLFSSAQSGAESGRSLPAQSEVTQWEPFWKDGPESVTD